MSQDGSKGPPVQNALALATNEPRPTVLLTLCLANSVSPSSHPQHATIPFPASYEDACRRALNVFAAYIPTNTLAVALRRAAKKADGTRVWSIIDEDDWDSVLERTGEEIGVFLPDNSASNLPYSQHVNTRAKKRLVHMYYSKATQSMSLRDSFEFIAVESFEDCKRAGMINLLGKIDSTKSIMLFFDQRMFGTTKEKTEYATSRLQDDFKTIEWSPIRSEETFDYLFDFNPSQKAVSIKAQVLVSPTPRVTVVPRAKVKSNGR